MSSIYLSICLSINLSVKLYYLCVVHKYICLFCFVYLLTLPSPPSPPPPPPPRPPPPPPPPPPSSPPPPPVLMSHQYQLDELETDAEHLFPLIQNDAAFDGILPSLTIDSAHQAVTEAMHVLHTAPGPNEGVAPREMSQEACLVVSILQHWLIRHLCKRLMQLMTPEAVSLHRKQIPASLIDNYLSHQQHFSLKKLIDHHQTALESCKG